MNEPSQSHSMPISRVLRVLNIRSSVDVIDVHQQFIRVNWRPKLIGISPLYPIGIVRGKDQHITFRLCDTLIPLQLKGLTEWELLPLLILIFRL